MTDPIKFTKLEVAGRQVETAIELFFFEKDPVSIHTLSMAAFGVLRDLSGHLGPSFTMEQFTKWVRPEKEKQMWDAINRSSNFFKHADRDPHEGLDFNPDMNEVMLFLCVMLLSEFGCGDGLKFRTYVAWFTVMHPEFLKPEIPGEAPTQLRVYIELARTMGLNKSRDVGLSVVQNLLRNDESKVAALKSPRTRST